MAGIETNFLPLIPSLTDQELKKIITFLQGELHSRNPEDKLWTGLVSTEGVERQLKEMNGYYKRSILSFLDTIFPEDDNNDDKKEFVKKNSSK